LFFYQNYSFAFYALLLIQPASRFGRDRRQNGRLPLRFSFSLRRRAFLFSRSVAGILGVSPMFLFQYFFSLVTVFASLCCGFRELVGRSLPFFFFLGTCLRFAFQRAACFFGFFPVEGIILPHCWLSVAIKTFSFFRCLAFFTFPVRFALPRISVFSPLPFPPLVDLTFARFCGDLASITLVLRVLLVRPTSGLFFLPCRLRSLSPFGFLFIPRLAFPCSIGEVHSRMCVPSSLSGKIFPTLRCSPFTRLPVLPFCGRAAVVCCIPAPALSLPPDRHASLKPPSTSNDCSVASSFFNSSFW